MTKSNTFILGCSPSVYDLEEFNCEFEISPLELIQDVGVLVVEGRMPDTSGQGRKEGGHCWPATPHSEKGCCMEGISVSGSMVCVLSLPWV